MVRARSFDVVFNLAVHAELLYPSRTTTIDIEAEVTALLPLSNFSFFETDKSVIQ